MTNEKDSRLKHSEMMRGGNFLLQRGRRKRRRTSLGEYKARLPQAICGVELKKGVMSSCGGVITFHVDDCNSDKLERMSLEKPAQCITKKKRLSYERVHGGYRKR